MTLPRGDWQGLIGRAIEAVVITNDAAHDGFQQVHLVFTDGSTFEIYATGGMRGGSRLYRGNLAEVLGCECEKTEIVVYSAQTGSSR